MTTSIYFLYVDIHVEINKQVYHIQSCRWMWGYGWTKNYYFGRMSKECHICNISVIFYFY